MNDEIIAYIREHPDGTASTLIAERFLRFKNPNGALADTAVNAILKRDARAARGEDGLWRPSAIASSAGGDDTDIAAAPWVAVYLLTDAAQRSIAHISLWSPMPDVSCVYGAWLKDPAQFSEDDRERLCDPRDCPFDAAVAATAIDDTARALSGRIPVFFSQRQYSLFNLAAHGHGVSHGVDAYYLTSQLLRAAKEANISPLTLDNAAASLLGGFRAAESAYRQGELFCRVTAELIGRVKAAGIESIGALDARLCDESNFDFADKEISAKMIAELPLGAGVYGFTDKSGAYIYIGKAVNLRRRVENYFRWNDESPEKLVKLRAAAHGLTIHRCGSELEALIYEYRLIRKHRPALNSQKNISERSGRYKPAADSVAILPHAQDGFAVSVWIREGQKIKLRPFETNFCEEEAMVKELRAYFYSGTLPASTDDFPELEIVTRWLKRHRDDYPVIPVINMANAEEIVDAMKNALG